LINIVIPAGMIRMYGGTNIPVGWLACDGSLVSRTTYATLFAAVGVVWGNGDGVNTFALPDLRGRSPLGYVSSAGSGLTGRTFGSVGGEEAHQLSTAELAAHAHGVNQWTFNPGNSMHDPQHVHSYVNPLGGFGAVAGAGQYSPSGAVNTGQSPTGITFDNITSAISIQNNGSNGAHNTLHPFAVCYFLIKT
jgi:microcystin-dependent protein